MKYILFRFLKENINNANCKYCKKGLPTNYVGLSYRDGKGYIKTHKFHDICAVKKAPNLITNFIKNVSIDINEDRIKSIRKVIRGVPLNIDSSKFNEQKWWDSGCFYDVKLNTNTNLECGLSDKKIEVNELIIKKPVVNYGLKSFEVFVFKNVLQISNFDWDNFEKRLKISLSKSVSFKNQILEKLNSIDNPKIKPILNTIKNYNFSIYGLDVKRCKKELMCWDIYFNTLVSVSEQNVILEKFKDYNCTWFDNIHLEVRPLKDQSTKVFRDSIFIRLNATENRIFAAHFCKKGNYRESRALVYEQNNLIPYPFLFFNHNGFKNNPWQLYIKLQNPIENMPLGVFKNPILFSKHWLNKKLSLSKNNLWIKISGGYWDNIENQIEEELYLLHETFKIDTIVLNDLDNKISKSHWSNWSFQSINSKKMKEFNEIKTQFRTKNLKEIEEYDLKLTLSAAKECFNHAHEMGDPSSALEGLLDIIKDVPYELKKTKEYKEIIFLQNKLIDSII